MTHRVLVRTSEGTFIVAKGLSQEMADAAAEILRDIPRSIFAAWTEVEWEVLREPLREQGVAA